MRGEKVVWRAVRDVGERDVEGRDGGEDVEGVREGESAAVSGAGEARGSERQRRSFRAEACLRIVTFSGLKRSIISEERSEGVRGGRKSGCIRRLASIDSRSLEWEEQIA